MTIHQNPPKHYLGYVLPGKAPVILLPWILMRWSFMKHLGDRISRAGHPVYVLPGLKYNILSIPISAKSSGINRKIVCCLIFFILYVWAYLQMQKYL